MAKDFNQAIVMGNLTRDPEMRTTPSGQNVTSFSVATNRSWQDQSGEKKDAVEYHNIVAWGKLAELVNSYLKKGRKVLVSGRLQTRNWDAEDGSKRNRTETVAVISEAKILVSKSLTKKTKPQLMIWVMEILTWTTFHSK